MIGWETRIRTQIGGTKIRRPTVRRSPKKRYDEEVHCNIPLEEQRAAT